MVSVSFEVEVYSRTATFIIEKGREKAVYRLLSSAYDEWLENENEVCSGCCCEEWLQMKVMGAGYHCQYLNSIDWEE